MAQEDNDIPQNQINKMQPKSRLNLAQFFSEGPTICAPVNSSSFRPQIVTNTTTEDEELQTKSNENEDEEEEIENSSSKKDEVIIEREAVVASGYEWHDFVFNEN